MRCGMIAVSLLLGGLGAPIQRVPAGPQGPGIRVGFVHVAEGFTSSTPHDGIDAAYRMFSLPDMQSVCNKAQAASVTRLVPVTTSTQLRVHEAFSLGSLKVIALASSGSVVPHVPIHVEIEETWPPVLDLQSDHIVDAYLTPLRPGRFRFRIRTICAGKGAETSINARVVP